MTIKPENPNFSTLTPWEFTRLQRTAIPFYPSVLTSPHESRWPEKIITFFQKIWNWISSFFAQIFPSKKEEVHFPPAPAPEIQFAIQKIDAVVDESQFESKCDGNNLELKNLLPNQYPIRNLFLQIATPVLISWISGNKDFFIDYVANKAVLGSSSVLEKIANHIFPSIATHWKKMGSLVISTPLVWKVADDLGYPPQYFFFISVAMQGISIYAQKTKQIRDEMIFHK